MRRAVPEAWFLARILVRFVAVGVLCRVLATAVSHGGVWYLLFIPLVPLALFELAVSSAILSSWAKELRSAAGHS
jgi:hypothetical protein